MAKARTETARGRLTSDGTGIDDVAASVLDRVCRQKVDAVLFDCDGTLVDSEPICDRVWRALADELALSPAPGAATDGLSFEQRLATLRPTNPSLPPTEVVYREYWRRLRSAFDESLQPIDPIYALARDLIDARVPIAVVSNSAQERLQYTVSCALPLLTGVPLVGWTPRDRPKPYPDLYRRAASLVAVPPARCLAIEDSAVGARGATSAGMRAIILDAPTT